MCVQLKRKDYLVLETPYWIAYLADNQNYPGRSIIILKAHRSSLAEVSVAEWDDLKRVIDAFEKAFPIYGASPLNWSCLMNGAYGANGGEPHVHFHMVPRYKEGFHFHGLSIVDPNYGEHYFPGGPVLLKKEAMTLLQDDLAPRLVSFYSSSK